MRSDVLNLSSAELTKKSTQYQKKLMAVTVLKKH